MKKFYLILILALSQYISFGQPTFSLEDTLVQSDSNFCVSITTLDFTDIVATSFSINWDPTVLSFQDVQNFELPDLDLSVFDLSLVSEGKLGLDGWVYLDDGITLDEGSTIFDICFTPLTACGSSPLDFSNTPIPVYTSREQIYPINTGAFLDSGTVSIINLIHNAPSDTTICLDDFAQLEVEVAPTVTTINWSSVNGYIEFSCTDCLQPTVNFGSNTPLGESSDTVVVTVGDGNGCEETHTIDLNTTWYIDMFPNEPVRYFCEGDTIDFSNEDILIGPYSYVWYGPQGFMDTQIFPTIVNASIEDAGFYTVEVIDFNGCGFSIQFEVRPGIYIYEEEIIPESCPDNLDGSITVNVQGGEGDLEFLWSNGSTAPYTITGLVSGTYSLTVIDEIDCAGIIDNIVVDTGLVVSITEDTIICGGETLQLQVEAPNATAYQWYSLEPLSCTDCPNPVVESAFLDDIYIVEVTGPNGCMQTEEINVQVREYLDFGLLEFSNSPLCEGDTLFFEPNLFNAQSYEWTGPGNFHSTESHPFVANVTPGNAGTYNLEIIDDAGCMTGASFDVILTNELEISTLMIEAACFGNCDGSIDLFPINGTPPYTYTWSNGEEGANINNLCAGAYEVTVNSQTCSTTAAFTVEEPTELSLQYEVTANASCLGGGGMITIWITGGYAPYLVEWEMGQVPGGSILDNLSAGTYNITVSDANGCAVFSPPIEVTDNPIYDISDDILICDGEMTPLMVDAPFASSINWAPTVGLDDPTSLTPIAAPPVTTTYTATVTDFDGCMGTASVTVFVGDDNCIWVNRDTINIGESGEWCDPTLGPLGLEITEVTCGPEGFVDFSVNDIGNCYNYTGLSIGQDSVCMTLCYTGTSDCFEALFVVVVTEDPVWPGDTNTDGIANHFDLLNLGLGFSATGPTRPDASLEWIAQNAPNWSQHTPISNVNYKHIDTDGDGQINFGDIMAIGLNWGQEHEFNREEEFDRNALIPFYIEPDTLIEGAEISLPVILGDMGTPAQDIYGLAFSLIYDPDVIVPGSAELDFTESWLGDWQEDAVAIQKDFHPEGRIDVGITRIDGNNVSGSGTIGHLILTIEDDILLFQPENNFVNNTGAIFDIQNVRLIDFNEELISVNTSPTESEIVTSTRQADVLNQIKVFPNPAQDLFFIECQTFDLEQIDIMDLNGRIIQSLTPQNAQTAISTKAFPDGVYLIRAYSQNGLFGKKIVLKR